MTNPRKKTNSSETARHKKMAEMIDPSKSFEQMVDEMVEGFEQAKRDHAASQRITNHMVDLALGRGEYYYHYETRDKDGNLTEEVRKTIKREPNEEARKVLLAKRPDLLENPEPRKDELTMKQFLRDRYGIGKPQKAKKRKPKNQNR